MIDAYLTCKAEADDAAMHLLFSANRWEKRCAPGASPQAGLAAPALTAMLPGRAETLQSLFVDALMHLIWATQVPSQLTQHTPSRTGRERAAVSRKPAHARVWTSLQCLGPAHP